MSEFSSEDSVMDGLNELQFEMDEQLTEKHWQILEAALKVFAEKGFSASRTSEVAKEAGVSEGTVFNYFKTKKDLLLGMLFPLFIRFIRPLLLSEVERIFKSRSERNIEDVLQDLMKERIQIIQSNLPLIKTMAIEAAFHPELIDPIREKAAPVVLKVGTKFFQDEIQKGTFREDVEAHTALRAFMSLIGGYVLMKNVLPDTFAWSDEETEIKKMLDIYLNGVKKQES